MNRALNRREFSLSEFYDMVVKSYVHYFKRRGFDQLPREWFIGDMYLKDLYDEFKTLYGDIMTFEEFVRKIETLSKLYDNVKLIIHPFLRYKPELWVINIYVLNL